MNLKNLAMWGVIVFLTIGLYNMFKHPQGSINKKDTIIFSEFLSEVDNGRVVEVQIQGNNIHGILSNGNRFSTYSPNDPNLIEKLTNRGVSISDSIVKINYLKCKKFTLGGCFIEKINETVFITREN